MADIELRNVLCKETVDVADKKFKNKDELFRYMSNMFKEAGYISDFDEFVKDLYVREEMGSTYMENNLVLPHGKSDSVIRPGVAICRFKPMKYNEDSEDIAKIAVMLAIPKKTQDNNYLRLLAKVSTALLDENVFDTLMNANEAEEVVNTMIKKING